MDGKPERKFGMRVGQHVDLARRAMDITPGLHHMGVIHRETGNSVNAGSAEIIRPGDKFRQMLGRTCGGKSSWQDEQHSPAAGEIFKRVVGINTLVGLDLDGGLRDMA